MSAEKRDMSQTSGPSASAAGAEVSCSAKGPGRSGEARRARLEQIRKQIQNGTYETEGKLRIAITRLIDDVLGRRTKNRG